MKTNSRAKSRLVALACALCLYLWQENTMAVATVRASFVREKLGNQQKMKVRSRVRSKARSHLGVRMMDWMDDDVTELQEDSSENMNEYISEEQ